MNYFQAPHFTLVKEALIEIGCVVTSLVVGRWLVGCHARALWPNNRKPYTRNSMVQLSTPWGDP